MSSLALPIRETIRPTRREDVARAIEVANETETPLYVIGGGTGLTQGAPASQEGDALDLSGLDKVIDYPARDMTITLEAGVTMAQIKSILAAEGQQLPIDAPQDSVATIGGVVASNWNGPRRYGLGTVRDYVIGVEAVDGRGVAFKGGGRVVKNVAGYDFCKLLTGSFGTLGVMTQVTLKVKPLTETRAWVVAACPTLGDAEALLAAQVDSAVGPVALELVAGPLWDSFPLPQPPSGSAASHVAALLEGPAVEVAWSVRTLQDEWNAVGNCVVERLEADEAEFWRRMVEFGSLDAELILKANLRPSGVSRFVEEVLRRTPDASVQSHAGNGVVLVSFPTFPERGLHATLAADLRPMAARYDGSVVVLSNPSGLEMTNQTAWGSIPAEPWMQRLKKKFDPAGVLNPGRFVYAHQ